MSGHKARLEHWLAWICKGGLAILDQGLFAGANFIVNVLLASWLQPTQYGVFAIAYAIFLLLASFHSAGLTEPMIIFGAGKYADCFPQYLGRLIYGHWFVTGSLTLILALVACAFWLLGAHELALALGGLALSALPILLLWLVRRAFYVHGQPQWAAAGGALYLTLVLAGIYGLHHQHLLSAASALLVMGMASLVVSLWLAKRLGVDWHGSHAPQFSRRVFNDHWQYGRWAGATALCVWVPGNLYFALLPMSTGVEGSAALRAIMNLVMPVLHANSALAVLLLPKFVTTARQHGVPAMRHLVRAELLLFGTGALLYWMFLMLFRDQLVTWLYGGNYREYADLLSLIGVLPFFSGVLAVLGGTLRAWEQPDQIFWCYVVSALVAVVLGPWLLVAHGVAGAVVGQVVSSGAGTIVMVWLYISQAAQKHETAL